MTWCQWSKAMPTDLTSENTEALVVFKRVILSELKSAEAELAALQMEPLHKRLAFIAKLAKLLQKHSEWGQK